MKWYVEMYYHTNEQEYIFGCEHVEAATRYRAAQAAYAKKLRYIRDYLGQSTDDVRFIPELTSVHILRG